MSARWVAALAALWWGGLTALTFVAVPTAFAHWGDPALAGPFAARLFRFQAWASVVFAGLIWVLCAWRSRRAAQPHTRWWPWLALAAVAALLQNLWVADYIVQARARGEDVALWHRLGTFLVLLQWVCAAWVGWRSLGR